MSLSIPHSGARVFSTLLWVGAFVASLYIVNRWQLGFFMTSVTLLFVWAAYTLGLHAGSPLRIPRSGVLGFAAAFWALVFASIFWSELPLVSLSSFCFFSALPLTLFVFVLSADDAQFRLAGALTALTLAALAIWAVIQYYIAYNPFGGQAHHPLADPNALGGLFNLGFIPAIGWMILTRNKTHSLIALALAALIFAGLLATGSRGAFFALIPALALLGIYGYRVMAPRRRHLGALGLLVVGLFALSHFTGQFDWNTPTQRMAETITLSKADVTNNRLNIWDGAIEVIKHHGLIGTGIGTFSHYYQEHRSPAEHIGVSHAHSDPLQYWAELGIAGIVLFYLFLIAVVVRTWRAIKMLAPDDPQRLMILAPFCALGAVVIQTHVSFNFYNLVILFGAGFLMAFWFIATQRVLKDRIIETAFPPTLGLASRRLLLTLPFVPLLFLFSSYMLSEHYVNAARDSLFGENDLQGFAANLQTAHGFDHGLNFRTWLLAANIPMGIMQENANNLDNSQREELYQQAAGQLARAHALNPRSASVLYYQARLQELVPPEMVAEGTPSREDLYARALTLDPLHLNARLSLSQIYEKKGEEDKAMEILEGGLAYQYSTPRAMDYYGRMMMLYLARSEREKSQEMMNKMVQFRHRMEISARMDARRGLPGDKPVIGREDVAR